MTAIPTMKRRVADVIETLERSGSKKAKDELLTRYGITAPKAFGVSMANIQKLAKSLGHDHELAAALWDTGWYEARLLTAYVDDPAKVTAAQMDRWTRDFDNWGVCDTLCFKLFDRTPHVWSKIPKWSKGKGEFVKRTGFALLACVALHDKTAPDAPFLQSLALIEGAANDERNFVKKAVSWALHAIGTRNKTLRTEALTLAKRLVESDDATERWIGKDVVRKLSKSSGTSRKTR